MVCRIAELQYKEVIDISDGTRYGFVEDVELDPERGVIESIVVAGRPRFFWPAGAGAGSGVSLVLCQTLRGGHYSGGRQKNGQKILKNSCVSRSYMIKYSGSPHESRFSVRCLFREVGGKEDALGGKNQF